jgi:hypothetical protein
MQIAARLMPINRQFACIARHFICGGTQFICVGRTLRGKRDFFELSAGFSGEISMTNILNRGFSQSSVDAFVTKVKFIIAQLTGNPNFATTDPTLAQMQTALDALTQALTISNPAARDAAVQAARDQLEQLLENLADNLEKTANNDPVKLATSGFDLRKDTIQTGEPPAVPTNVRLKATGVSGEAQLLCDAPDRGRGIQVQTAPDPNNGPWTDYDIFSSTRRMILKGFPRAKDLWARARTLGPNNTKSGWSDPATILIS